MKEKLISRLVMGALVGLTATGAYAGQIQSSSVSIAREVITTDTQKVDSPSVSYRFFGDVDARIQDQTFQVQFTLENGAEWDNVGTAGNITMTDGVQATIVTQGVLAGNFEVLKLDLSTDKKTLFATIVVHQGAAALVKQPIIAISSAATKPQVVKLKQIVGDIGECDPAVKTLPVSFKHYVALSSPTTLATDANATPDEHTRSGSTNRTTLITFPTNLLVEVKSSAGNAKVNVAGSSLNFSGAATAPATGAAAPDVWTAGVAATATKVNLGRVALIQQAQGYDSDLANKYLLDGGATVGAATGLSGVATAVNKTGEVEAAKVDVIVSASQGFAVSANAAAGLWLDSQADCAGTVWSNDGAGAQGKFKITAANAAGPITLSIPAARLGGVNAFGTSGLDSLGAATAAGTGPVYVCYDATGTTAPIPGSAFNVTAATVYKAAAGASLNEQNNYCKGPLFPLSGSIKIDVRNFANASRSDGWMSIVRLINNSETRTANVYGQYIHADGKYGKSGLIATLAPRAVVNMTSSQIDAKLVTAPNHATASLNAAAGDTPHNAATQDAPRLRITSETADTLRVQNYLFNPASQNFIEASSSQGVDFSGTTDRAPASEGQYQDQDAQKGLNGGN